jgi:small subunit ribosomal protein S1
MVIKRDTQPAEPPVYDDGWWASILAEDPDRPPLLSTLTRNPYPVKLLDRDWENAKRLYHQDQIVSLRVTGYNRGGLLVEGEGLYGFVPFSHLVGMTGQMNISQREKELAAYQGRTLRLKVIECVPEDGRIVFSERAAQVEAGRRAELFSSLQVGQRIWGEVTNITDFGVFVDLGGVEGLIHISELSWGRVAHPSQIVHQNQRIEVQVLEVLPERCRVALSLKRLQPNPWEDAEQQLTVNQIVSAQITTLVSYGAFARLDSGMEGLIHVSEIPLLPGKNPKGILKEGQRVQVRILHIDAQHQRLGLSLRLEG